MQTYTANEARTRFGEFLDHAQREPVRVLPARLVRQVLEHGLPVFSPTTFAELETRL